MRPADLELPKIGGFFIMPGRPRLRAGRRGGRIRYASDWSTLKKPSHGSSRSILASASSMVTASGATLSSQAAVDAVNEAYTFLKAR